MAVKKHVKIKTLIIGTFLATIIGLSFSIGVIVFSNWYKLANRNGNLMADYITSNIETEINNFLAVPEHINEHNSFYLSNSSLDVSSLSSNESFFVDILKVYHQDIYSSVFVTTLGELYGAQIIGDDQYETMRMDSSTNWMFSYFEVNEFSQSGSLLREEVNFDPRESQWYINAVNSGEANYSSLYLEHMNQYSFTSSLPVYDDQNELIGVFATHIAYEKLNEFLATIVDSLGGTAVIFEKDTQYLIANSKSLDNYLIEDDITRYQFQEIVPKNIIDAYNYYLETGKTQFKYSQSGPEIYFNVIEYNSGQFEWVAISAIPVSFFMENVYRSLNYTIAIVISILFLGSFLYLKYAKSLFKSLDELVVTANDLSKGKLSVRAVKKRNDEIGILTDSFNIMADNLDEMVDKLEILVEQRTEALRLANDEIRESQMQLKSILDSTAEGIYGIDQDGNCTFINQSAIQLLGFDNDSELIGKNMHQLIHHHKEDGSIFQVKECPILKSVHNGESTQTKRDVFYKKDGSKLHVRFSSYPQYRNQKLIGAVISFADNTKEKEREEKIIYISYHDYLTSLYNRRYFVENLAKLDRIENYPLGIIMLDLNALKLYNDAFGHFVGDQALVKVARILEEITRHDGFVCRLGGDEFAIVLPHSSETEMHYVKHEIKNTIKEHDVEGVQLSLAIGYELKYNTESNLDEILKKAEDHMYKNKMSERLNVNTNAIMAILQTLFNKHPEEKKHAEEVSHYAASIGKALKLESDKVHDLSISGLYHDIGKISIPDLILDKPAALTPDEYEIIKKHAEIGYQILKAADEYSIYALHAYSHHEHFDGSGYPRGLKGKEIPLFSRIISIANAYQNMTTDRPYRKAKSQEEAVLELKQFSGKQFDPKLVNVFLKDVLKVN